MCHRQDIYFLTWGFVRSPFFADVCRFMRTGVEKLKLMTVFCLPFAEKEFLGRCNNK